MRARPATRARAATKTAFGSSASGEALDRLVALVRRAVFDAFPDSVPEGFTADFDLVNQYPVQSAELTFEFQDQFAFDNP